MWPHSAPTARNNGRVSARHGAGRGPVHQRPCRSAMRCGRDARRHQAPHAETQPRERARYYMHTDAIDCNIRSKASFTSLRMQGVQGGQASDTGWQAATAAPLRDHAQRSHGPPHAFGTGGEPGTRRVPTKAPNQLATTKSAHGRARRLEASTATACMRSSWLDCQCCAASRCLGEDGRAAIE